MPNHVTNIITAAPQVIAAITRAHTEEEIAAHYKREAELRASYKARTGEEWPYDETLPERFVDFSLVVPEPPNLEQGGCNGQHSEGVICWYGWNIANWGTKWNGYSTEIEPIEGDRARLRFDTAWSHPFPVITALAEKFPGEALEVEWADEDLGSNVGRYTIQAGKDVELFTPEYGDESLEMACQIKYRTTYAQYKIDNDIDDDE